MTKNSPQFDEQYSKNEPTQAETPQTWGKSARLPPVLSQKSQNLFRLNLDASRVPEALVNSFRLLTQLRTRLNPPEPQTPLNRKKTTCVLPTRLFSPNFLNANTLRGGNRPR